MQNENQDEYFSDDDKDEKDEKDDKDDREVRQKNKSKKTVEEKLFDVIFNTLESFRTYTGENGIPIAEEISYHDLYRFLTKS